MCKMRRTALSYPTRLPGATKVTHALEALLKHIDKPLLRSVCQFNLRTPALHEESTVTFFLFQTATLHCYLDKM